MWILLYKLFETY